jgi:hypothetical protein
MNPYLAILFLALFIFVVYSIATRTFNMFALAIIIILALLMFAIARSFGSLETRPDTEKHLGEVTRQVLRPSVSPGVTRAYIKAE